MKKNLIIAVLAVAFVASFSWNWVVKADRDKVAEAVEAVNTYIGNGGTFNSVSGGDGTLYITFTAPPTAPSPTILTVTVTNIDEEDISYVIN